VNEAPPRSAGVSPVTEAPPRSAGVIPTNEGASGAKTMRARAARLVAGLSLLGAALVVLAASRSSWRPERELLFARGSGWLACAMLLLALAVTAVDRVFRPRWPLPAPVLRRALGMGAAWLACVHALIALIGRLQGKWHVVLESAQLIAGLTALAVLVLLLLTSFDAVIRASKLRAWKELHRLAYAAALLVAQHVLLGPFASRRLALGLLLAIAALLALRLLPRRRSRA
jgi:sulfoxide reductase heme-binding subunit YedZ